MFTAFVGPVTAVEATLNDAQPSPGAADLTKAFDNLLLVVALSKAWRHQTRWLQLGRTVSATPQGDVHSWPDGEAKVVPRLQVAELADVPEHLAWARFCARRFQLPLLSRHQ